MRSFPLRKNLASLACGELLHAMDAAKKITVVPAASILRPREIDV
jgi:hypothetical protein